ncbi:MAG: glycosyltransferase [Flavobacteriaceae bacterium]
MKVSGIATVYNEEASCDYWIKSYIDQSEHCNELIIIDGFSTDKTFEKLKHYSKKHHKLNIKVFRSKKANLKHSSSPIAEGRNIAISKSKNDLIICFDFGCEYPINYVKEMSELLIKSKPRKNIVGGYFSARNKQSKTAQNYSKHFFPKISDLKQNFIPSSRSLAFQKNVWEEIKGYDTKYITGEDTDFILRALKHGFKIGYNTNVDVKWDNPQNLKQIFKKHRSYAQGKAEFKIKNKIFLRSILIFFPIYFFGGGFIVKYVVNLANVVGYCDRKFLR